MKIKRRKRARIDIADSGALSDLAFLLIIFFMVIAVFNINEGFLLELPGKDTARIVQVDDILKIRLTAENVCMLKGAPAGETEIENEIARVRKHHPNMTFVLSIDPEAEYQGVVAIVGLVRKTGVENFSFSMEKDAGVKEKTGTGNLLPEKKWAGGR